MKLKFLNKLNIKKGYVVDEPKHMKVIRALGSFAFYAVISMMIFSGVFSNQNGSDVKSLFGITPMYITTRSMEPLMEPGTLIFSKKTDASVLKVGDDISFLDITDSGTQRVITHRIVSITNEDDTLQFETKGINNDTADAKKVHPDNIIGKVSAVVPYAGILVSYLSENLLKVAVFIVVIYIMYIVFKWYLLSEKGQPESMVEKDPGVEE